VAVNPRRPDVRDRLLAEGISLVQIDELKDKAQHHAGGIPRERRVGSGRIVAVAEYRDGTVIDVIQGIEEAA
jgi:citrate lyase subunit alpha/citrate CoA-transferase